jgi:hypothetical protein
MYAVAATSFAEFPLITPHSTDSELSCANYYSNIEEN